jgi:hypothetical protein
MVGSDRKGPSRGPSEEMIFGGKEVTFFGQKGMIFGGKEVTIFGQKDLGVGERKVLMDLPLGASTAPKALVAINSALRCCKVELKNSKGSG